MLDIASNADRIGTAKPKISKEQQELQEHMIHSQKIKETGLFGNSIPF